MIACGARAEGLNATRLGVVYNSDDPVSRDVAAYYAKRRFIAAENLVAIHVPAVDVMSPAEFEPLRRQVLERLPASVQSLLLIWSRPWAVGCMSVTTAFAAGYRSDFCTTACSPTIKNPLYDAGGWLPADTIGWWPAMLLPTKDSALARALIDRGVAADETLPPGTLYLVATDDAHRNVRAQAYEEVAARMQSRLRTEQIHAPIGKDRTDAIGYFTGAIQVEELPRLRFRPGAVADHLTSFGGVLEGGRQMSALAWLAQGATASYGTVSEPCNATEKFPDVAVLFEHYLHGETVLESYWKSVAMPGQGLFIGEPLARPFRRHAP